MTQSSLDPNSIFAQALEIEDAAKRQAFLQQACGGDAGLRSEIQEMLELQAHTNGFMRSPGALNSTHLKQPKISEKPGTWIGPYKLLQQIGEGGMGTVFLAEQERPVRRKVALKIIKPGMDSGQVIARFEAERQALAMMDHTNIAKVLDAGTTDSGRPYFVMELVHGVPITEYCDANHLTHRERLELFIPVCQALQHAHQKGIIHRDVKPSNILVTLYDDKPVPKVIDFGVAKAVEQRLTERTLFTQHGALVGTFEYMSPEQAELNAFGVDTRSDVYSLGVLLYELLTGTTPLEKSRLRQAAYGELVRIIKEEEPPRPSIRISTSGAIAKLAVACNTEAAKLSSLVKGELDWIVMKCLEKDRTRRYEGASALARDVRKYLTGEAVEACPPTLGYRLQKAYRKNRAAVMVGSTLATVLLLATCVSLIFGIQAWRAGRQAAKSAEKANADRQALEDEQNARAKSDYFASIQFSWAGLEQHNRKRAQGFLDRTRPDLRGWEWHYLNRLCQPEKPHKLATDREHIQCARYSPDGRWIVTLGATVQVWDTATWKSFELCSGLSEEADLDISPDSRQVLVTDRDKVTIWEIESPRTSQSFTIDNPNGARSFARFSPDGTKIATAIADRNNTKADTVVLWNAKTHERLSSSFKEPQTEVYSLSFADGGRWVAAEFWKPSEVDPSKQGNYLKIWDADTGEVILEVRQTFSWARISSDGSWITAQERHSSKTKVWRIRRNGDHLKLDDHPISLRGHTGATFAGAFSRDSRYLATTGADETVRIWDAATGAQVRVLAGAGIPSFVDFSPDSQNIVTSGTKNNRQAHVWAVEATDLQLVSKAEARVYTSIPSPNGDRLLILDKTGTIVCEAGTLKPLLPHPLAYGRGGWSPDGSRIWISSDKIRIYSAESGQLLHELDGVNTPETDYCCNTDGSQVLTVKKDGSVSVWDTRTGQIWQLSEPDRIGFFTAGYSPDGTKIFVRKPGPKDSDLARVSILDAETRKPIVELETGESQFSSGSFTRDGQWFIALLNDRDGSPTACRIWDATTGKLLRSFPVNKDFAMRLEISPDGSRILLAGILTTMHLIDTQTGDELLALPFDDLRSAKFDRNGNKIIVKEGDKVRVLDGTPMPEPKK